jgi:hypothetical protein
LKGKTAPPTTKTPPQTIAMLMPLKAIITVRQVRKVTNIIQRSIDRAQHLDRRADLELSYGHHLIAEKLATEASALREVVQ